jgi:hypothetical protein
LALLDLASATAHVIVIASGEIAITFIVPSTARHSRHALNGIAKPNGLWS